MKSRSKTTQIVMTMIAGLLLFTSSLSGQEQEAKSKAATEYRPLANTGIPAAFVPMVVEKIKAEGVEEFPILVAIKNAKDEPAIGEQIGARWGDGQKTSFKTNENGHLEIDLLSYSADLVLDVPAGFSAKVDAEASGFKIDMTSSGGFGEGDSEMESLDLKRDFELLDVGHNKIYYSKGSKKFAEDAARGLSNMRGFISGVSGIDLYSGYAIALIDDEMADFKVEGEIVVPIVEGAWEKGFDDWEDFESEFTKMGHWLLMHEWVETTLVLKHGLYSKDPGLRFVGDGFADYFSAAYVKTRHPNCWRLVLDSYKDNLEELLKKGITSYDLPVKFKMGQAQASVETQAGYPLGFVFWNQFVEKQGSDALRKVITKIMDRTGGMDYDALVAEIKEITGEEISTTMDVAESLKYIEKLLK